MGRKTASNPKAVHLGIRIDPDMAQKLDREIKRETDTRPGLSLNRSSMVRMLIAEALLARSRR